MNTDAVIAVIVLALMAVTGYLRTRHLVNGKDKKNDSEGRTKSGR